MTITFSLSSTAVQPAPMATICRIFHFDCDVIAVVEEAQFQGKRVLFWRDAPGGNIRMRVSQTSDDGRELHLATRNGFALLRALGIEADYAGTLPVEEVRALLLDDETRRQIEDHALGCYAERLIQLIEHAPTSSAETLMTWA